MVKILILSDSPFLPTGFRNQSFLLAEHLAAQGHELFWLAPSHVGAPIKNAELPDGRKCPWTILPGGRQPHALDVLPKRIMDIKPDILYVLLDSFMLYNNEFMNMSLPMPSTYWWGYKSALWFPSDGGYFPRGCENVLKKFDKPVAMAKWARDQVKNLHAVNAEYIPHGIKTAMFRPLDENNKKQLRIQYSRKCGKNLLDKFIVGCVARNQPRKFMDRTIKTFSLFSKDKKDALLLLHSDPNDPAQPYPITELIKRFDCENRILWTGMSAVDGFPDEKMYEIYNLMDLKLDTTSGEGFGVTIIESMACEVPIVITDYTTTKELVLDHKAGLPIRLVGEDEDLYEGRAESKVTNQITGGWGVERGVCDINHGVEQLNKCYEDWKNGGKMLREMGVNGRKAVLENYDFDTCVWPQWDRLFKELIL